MPDKIVIEDKNGNITIENDPEGIFIEQPSDRWENDERIVDTIKAEPTSVRSVISALHQFMEQGETTKIGNLMSIRGAFAMLADGDWTEEQFESYIAENFILIRKPQ